MSALSLAASRELTASRHHDELVDRALVDSRNLRLAASRSLEHIDCILSLDWLRKLIDLRYGNGTDKGLVQIVSPENCLCLYSINLADSAPGS